jgi:hypothetical protein
MQNLIANSIDPHVRHHRFRMQSDGILLYMQPGEPERSTLESAFPILLSHSTSELRYCIIITMQIYLDI